MTVFQHLYCEFYLTCVHSDGMKKIFKSRKKNISSVTCINSRIPKALYVGDLKNSRPRP